ncbi:hypothetical protein BD779DRAFT_1672903 [Infundibulicybe gibba]|nr:hypothetical protein BD779DRAFT_1672903 [Infundibulicybe gibba]
MHRCLLVPEILRIICGHIRVDHQSRDLLAVALVCRSFYNISISLLWRQISGLLPLIKGLPSDVWRAPPIGHNAILARAIAPSDLERFRAHAYYVQVYYEHYVHAPISIYQALSFHFHDQPVFPNLVEITWMDQKTEIFPFISMFLGPHIRKMSLRVSDDSIQNSLLSTLGKKCPSLVYFDLYTLDCYPNTGRQMKSLLSQWSQLETLIIRYLPEESLRIIAGLPHLRRLKLYRADDDYGDTFIPIPNTKVFPALQDLSITANSPVLCINILRAATSCLLREFAFSLYGSNPPVWRELFATLVKSCDKDTLTTIYINDLAVGHGEPWNPGMTDELRLLFPFTGLRYILFETRYGFNIDDASVREIAVAWPHIRTLNIGVNATVGTIQPPQLTLHGLAPLAELCPELQTLGVYVNAAHICSNHSDLCLGSESWVNVLNVGCSPISTTSVPWAAAFLSTIFPELHNLWTDDWADEGPPSEYSVRWTEVRNHLVAYRHMSGLRRNDSPCPDCEPDPM